MTGAIWWKEYREHRAVWATMAVVGAMGMYGLAALFAQDVAARRDLREMLCGVAILMSWAYGLVAGAMLLAGEREANTLVYLDGLPAYRLQLWTRKFLFGLALMVAQALVLGGLGMGLKLVEPTPFAIGAGVFVLLCAGFLGLSWGLLFSSVGRNVLNAIGLAILGQIVGSFLMTFLAVVFTFLLFPFFHNEELSKALPILCSALLMAVGPLVASAIVFSRPDRTRLPARYARQVGERLGLAASGKAWWVKGQPSETAVAARPPVAAVSWSRVVWLAVRQLRGLALGVGLFGLICGFFVPLGGIILWPLVTLILGMVCGVAAFRDEQEIGCYRFYGDQRLPLGKVWLVKVTAAFAIGVMACLLMLLPSTLREIAHSFFNEGETTRHVPFLARVMHSGLLGEVVPPLVFLSVWLAYGFAAGHLCGLLFRKTIVAGTVALLSSSLLVSVWVPSLFAGGLHGWQVFGAPLALVAAGRLLLWRWASDRLASRGTFVGLGAMGVFCVGWAAFGLWWRVAEPPEVEDRFHIEEYAKHTLPDPEHNTAGMAIRGALGRVGSLERNLEADRPINQQQAFQPGVPGMPGQEPPHVTFRGQLQAVLEDGWHEASPELGQWLDRAFDNEWPKQLAEAAGEPLGLVQDPRNLSATTRVRSISSARFCTTLLMARGLQKESEGDPAAFVHNLRSGLALARNLRHLALSESVDSGIAVEEICTRAVERWLERLRGRPDLLKQALALLLAHERETPRDSQDQEKGEYLIALNSLNDVESWLPGALLFDDPTGRASPGRDFHRIQATLVNYSLLVPWERERQLRLLRALLEGDEPQRRAAMRMGGPLQFAGVLFGRRPSFSKRTVAQLHAAQLQVALRLYEAESGRPAKALGELLQKRYLQTIPTDPFDGQPFRYRLSKGEKIEWPKSLPPDMPPGAGGPAAGGMGAAPGGGMGMAGMPPPAIPGMPGPVGGVPDPAAPPGAAAPPGLPALPGAGGGMGGPPGMGGAPAMPGGPGGPVEVPPEVKEVPAGQGILWSVGEDGQDDGGLRRPRPDEFSTMDGHDLIYLVPLPPGKQAPPKKPARR